MCAEEGRVAGRLVDVGRDRGRAPGTARPEQGLGRLDRRRRRTAGASRTATASSYSPSTRRDRTEQEPVLLPLGPRDQAAAERGRGAVVLAPGEVPGDLAKGLGVLGVEPDRLGELGHGPLVAPVCEHAPEQAVEVRGLGEPAREVAQVGLGLLVPAQAVERGRREHGELGLGPVVHQPLRDQQGPGGVALLEQPEGAPLLLLARHRHRSATRRLSICIESPPPTLEPPWSYQTVGTSTTCAPRRAQAPEELDVELEARERHLVEHGIERRSTEDLRAALRVRVRQVEEEPDQQVERARLEPADRPLPDGHDRAGTPARCDRAVGVGEEREEPGHLRRLGRAVGVHEPDVRAPGRAEAGHDPAALAEPLGELEADQRELGVSVAELPDQVGRPVRPVRDHDHGPLEPGEGLEQAADAPFLVVGRDHDRAVGRGARARLSRRLVRHLHSAPRSAAVAADHTYDGHAGVNNPAGR